MKQIGILTIGEAPRQDLIENWSLYFDETILSKQKGVIDKLVPHQIKRLAPKTGDTLLVTKTADGRQIKLGKQRILSIIQTKINEFANEDIDLILLACTGSFPNFQSSIPLIYPDHLLGHALKGLYKQPVKLHIIVPSPLQTEAITQKWNSFGFGVEVSACSPYQATLEDFSRLGEQLKYDGCEAIVLDCMGYNEEMKQQVEISSAKPVILSRRVIYKNMAELL